MLLLRNDLLMHLSHKTQSRQLRVEAAYTIIQNVECQRRITVLATATSPGTSAGMCNTRFLSKETNV